MHYFQKFSFVLRFEGALIMLISSYNVRMVVAIMRVILIKCTGVVYPRDQIRIKTFWMRNKFTISRSGEYALPLLHRIRKKKKTYLPTLGRIPEKQTNFSPGLHVSLVFVKLINDQIKVSPCLVQD